jgi:hypothetical protein
VFGLVALAIALIYYYAPDAEQQWIWITPGSIFATAAWLLVSLAFRFYVTRFTSYNATYGAIGGAIVMMLWFYFSALAVLVGAELNAEIEHASPYGKNPGEKKIGEKKPIAGAPPPPPRADRPTTADAKDARPPHRVAVRRRMAPLWVNGCFTSCSSTPASSSSRAISRGPFLVRCSSSSASQPAASSPRS